MASPSPWCWTRGQSSPSNWPPNWVAPPPGAVQLGRVYRYPVAAADPDGDPLTFTLPTAPTGMTVDASGLLTWTATASQVGSHPVELRVADGGFAQLTIQTPPEMPFRVYRARRGL